MDDGMHAEEGGGLARRSSGRARKEARKWEPGDETPAQRKATTTIRVQRKPPKEEAVVEIPTELPPAPPVMVEPPGSPTPPENYGDNATEPWYLITPRDLPRMGFHSVQPQRGGDGSGRRAFDAEEGEFQWEWDGTAFWICTWHPPGSWQRELRDDEWQWVWHDAPGRWEWQVQAERWQWVWDLPGKALSRKDSSRKARAHVKEDVAAASTPAVARTAAVAAAAGGMAEDSSASALPGTAAPAAAIAAAPAAASNADPPFRKRKRPDPTQSVRRRQQLLEGQREQLEACQAAQEAFTRELQLFAEAHGPPAWAVSGKTERDAVAAAAANAANANATANTAAIAGGSAAFAAAAAAAKAEEAQRLLLSLRELRRRQALLPVNKLVLLRQRLQRIFAALGISCVWLDTPVAPSADELAAATAAAAASADLSDEEMPDALPSARPGTAAADVAAAAGGAAAPWVAAAAPLAGAVAAVKAAAASEAAAATAATGDALFAVKEEGAAAAEPEEDPASFVASDPVVFPRDAVVTPFGFVDAGFAPRLEFCPLSMHRRPRAQFWDLAQERTWPRSFLPASNLYEDNLAGAAALRPGGQPARMPLADRLVQLNRADSDAVASDAGGEEEEEEEDAAAAELAARRQRVAAGTAGAGAGLPRTASSASHASAAAAAAAAAGVEITEEDEQAIFALAAAAAGPQLSPPKAREVLRDVSSGRSNAGGGGGDQGGGMGGTGSGDAAGVAMGVVAEELSPTRARFA